MVEKSREGAFRATKIGVHTRDAEYWWGGREDGKTSEAHQRCGPTAKANNLVATLPVLGYGVGGLQKNCEMREGALEVGRRRGEAVAISKGSMFNVQHSTGAGWAK